MLRILGIKILKGCYKSVHKILKVGETYLLYDDYKKDEGNENTLKHVRQRTEIEKYMYDIVCGEDREIEVSVCGIVGKNGDGKSTFIEIVLRILNNFAYAYGFRTDQESLRSNIGVAGILYYEVDGVVYAIRCDGGSEAYNKGESVVSFYENGTRITDIDECPDDIRKKDKLKEKHLKELFYTMVINYSLYAYNSRSMQQETKDGSSWIDELFHKNDSYQTPAVLNPMRTEGNIDINNEEDLSRQRLLSLYTIADNDSERMVNDHEIAYGLAFHQENESKFIEKTIKEYFIERHRDDYKWESLDIYFNPIDNNEDKYWKEKKNICGHFLNFWKDFENLQERYPKLQSIVSELLIGEGMGRSGESDFHKYVSEILWYMETVDNDAVEPYKASLHKFLKEPFSTMNYAEFYRMVRIMIVWELLKEKCKEIDCDLEEALNHRREPLYAAKFYILYKVIEIMNTYTPYKYGSYIEDHTFQMFANSIENNTGFSKMKYDLEDILKRDDYITLKLNQTLNYIRNYQEETAYYGALNSESAIPNYEDKYTNNYFVKFDNLKTLLGHFKSSEEVSQIMRILPPPIFVGDIIIKNGKAYHGMDSMSSGERQRLNSVGSFNYHLRNLDAEVKDNQKIQYKNILVVFEEVELYFHPEYQKTYINYLLKQIKQMNLQGIKSISLLFVTHSPFILSDVVKHNILYLEKGEEVNHRMKVNTFASNINELLAESFFLSGGFVGEFAKEKINELVNFLLSDKELLGKWNRNIARDLIELVGDEVVRIQLRKLFAKKFGKQEHSYKEWLKSECERLGID